MEEFASLLRRELAARGPVSFREWMRRCLFDPAFGYYVRPGRKTGPGRDADFVTPPTLHPFLGRAVAQELAQWWHELGRPVPFSVLEFGGGEGDLARNALAALDWMHPDAAAALVWNHEDPSPHSVAVRQADGADGRIRTWSWAPDAEVGHAPPKAHVVVAVEVLDAIPCDLYERRPDGWQEVSVALDGDAFALQARGPTVPLPYPGEVGDRVASSGRAWSFLEDALARSGAQRAFVLDYGGPGAAGDVRGYRAHREVSVLDRPGETDITYSIDFSSRILEPAWQAAPLESLEAFLLRHGILEALNAIDRSTTEGASSYLRLRQLLLPTGLGAAFKVQSFRRALPLGA